MASSTSAMEAETVVPVAAAQATATTTGRIAAGQVCGAARLIIMVGVKRPYSLCVAVCDV